MIRDGPSALPSVPSFRMRPLTRRLLNAGKIKRRRRFIAATVESKPKLDWQSEHAIATERGDGARHALSQFAQVDVTITRPKNQPLLLTGSI
jgi:hypothetical protein